MTESEAIAVNACLRDIIHSEGWFDPDNFGLRASQAIVANLASGFGTDDAVAKAIRDVPTKFYQANKGAKGTLLAELPAALATRGLMTGGLIEVLRDFKRFAERQLVGDFVEFKNEAIGRSHLQTYLEKLGRTYREVHVGAGRSDILLFLPETTEIIETKVWGGQQNHADGIVELRNYMAGEGLTRGYYVVFEYHRLDPITPDEDLDPGGRIQAVFVHIPLTAPSKLGLARRQQVRRP